MDLSLSDLIDGTIAREGGTKTALGEILDPIADAWLVGCILYNDVIVPSGAILPMKGAAALLGLAILIVWLDLTGKAVAVGAAIRAKLSGSGRAKTEEEGKIKTAAQLVGGTWVILGIWAMADALTWLGAVLLLAGSGALVASIWYSGLNIVAQWRRLAGTATQTKRVASSSASFGAVVAIACFVLPRLSSQPPSLLLGAAIASVLGATTFLSALAYQYPVEP
jgi:phosphatidylglycerophosphate synthase